MTNYFTKLIAFLLIPTAIFVLNPPIQAEAREQLKMESSLVTPLDIHPVEFDFEKGQIKFTVNGDAFKARVKLNQLTGTLLANATSMSLILDCRVSRVSNGEIIERSFPVTLDIPLDAAIKGKNLKHKEKGSLSELATSLGFPSDIENGDVLEVLSVRIALDGVIVAVPGFQADLSDDGKGNDDDDDKGKDNDDDDKGKDNDDDDKGKDNDDDDKGKDNDDDDKGKDDDDDDSTS